MTISSPQLSFVGALASTATLLAAAVSLGLQWPGMSRHAGPDDVASLDYSVSGHAFEALSDAYVRTVLGIGDRDDSKDAPGENAGTTSIASDQPALHTPTDVSHPFTNDRFEDAYAIPSLPFRAQSDTTGATRERSEPAQCLPAGGTVWYRYQALADVGLFANTFGTGRAATIGVFRGTSMRDLTVVGCDTNILGNAQIGFRAAKDATYYFQVTSPPRGGPTVLALAAVGATTIETVSPSGERADVATDASNNRGDLSADGRWLAFLSTARNLTPTPPECGSAPTCGSLYLRDRMTGTTTLVATAAAAESEGSGLYIFHPTMSPDGRYVGFTHWSVPGVPGFRGAEDAPAPAMNAYLYDRITRRFELVSRNSSGEPARGQPGRDGGTTGVALPAASHGALAPSFSADGRYVTFMSDGANLGGHVEYGHAYNVYRRDRVTGVTRLVSVDSKGKPMVANSFACTGRNLSGDGRYAFFSSTFGTGQDNVHIRHLYLWDATTGRTRLVTRLPKGEQTLGSYCPAISLDGSRTAFVSRDALIPEDTNGTPDVYAYDVATERLRRVSVTSAGEQTTDANYASTEESDTLPRAVSLSADGRYIAFDSAAPDLVPSWIGSSRRTTVGVPGPIQVYVHDVVTGATVLASVSSIGEPLAGNSVVPYLSADGRSVAFLNSSQWTTRNSVAQLDVMVHRLS